MSDTEETHQEETSEEQQETADEERPKGEAITPVLSMGGDDKEAVHVLEDVTRRKAEKLEEELEEYREMRKEEKLREAEAIEELKRKRIERQAQRVEEEKRLAASRQQEEARRKAEEEERKRKKIEEEMKRKAERERKRKEAEKRKGPKTPNYKIVKKQSDGTEIEEEEVEEKKTPQKSKEQLEQEKQAILAQRITPLEIDGLNLEALVEAAKGLHQKLWNLISSQYDLEERFQRQQYDMVELAERARMMSKVKKRGIASAQVDESYDRTKDKHSNAPPPILLASKFERNLDRRTWEEKLKCYSKDDFDVTPHAFYAFA